MKNGSGYDIENIFVFEQNFIFIFDIQTPVHSACMKGRKSCIEILLQYGANVNIKNVFLRGVIEFVLFWKKM